MNWHFYVEVQFFINNVKSKVIGIEKINRLDRKIKFESKGIYGDSFELFDILRHLRKYYTSWRTIADLFNAAFELVVYELSMKRYIRHAYKNGPLGLI